MDDASITAAFDSQYRAALAMFRNAVAAVPAAKWDDPADVNRTWRIAYHVLYFTHLYLSGSEERFEPWELAINGAEHFEEPFAPPDDSAVAGGAYSREQILSYADAIEAMLPALVPSHPYDGPSGFSWITVGRFEHHVRNIRHLQHHTGQLSERARASGGDGLEWTGAARR